jgi:aspartate 1-decarboxylase
MRHLMKSKIHRATITAADLHYEGSLTVDADLLDAADLREHEMVDVVNVNNGSRLTTYIIPGARGSGVIQLNGAAARTGMVGDLVIVIAYGLVTADEAERHVPAVVFVDGRNRIVAPGTPR